jgi:hypothetical protein
MRPDDKAVFYALDDSSAAILTIYGEARGESLTGRQMVAQVIANRAARQGKSIKDVVYAPNQFSCYLSTDPNYMKLVEIARAFNGSLLRSSSLVRCADAWKGDRREIAKRLDGATFYRVVGTKNAWFDKAVKTGKLVKVCQEGHHEVYRET